MTTLAQHWLYGVRKSDVDLNGICKYDAFVERHPRMPVKANNVLFDANRVADRFAFSDDIPVMMHTMAQNKQIDIMSMLKTTKLPSDIFWIEYATLLGANDKARKVDGPTHIGALVNKLGDGRVRMVVIAGIDFAPVGKPFVSEVVEVVEFPSWPPQVSNGGMTVSIYESFRINDLHPGGRALGDLLSFLSEIIFGIFLLTQPKVMECEDHKPSVKMQRARQKAGKPPLIEFRRVKLKIGTSAKKATSRGAVVPIDTDGEDAIRHRRYHRVLGHFRHYVNAKEPHTTWVEAYYRGDPALGVLFTEREVVKGVAK